MAAGGGTSEILNIILNLKDRMSGPLNSVTNKIKGFKSNLDKVNAKIKSFRDGAVAAFKKVAVAAAAVGAATYKILDAAADMQAVNAQFSQVFGDLEKQAETSLQKIAGDTGVLENRLKGSYTQIAAFAKTTGMETSSALDLANRATVAVADSAAFYDRSIEDVTESLQSFLKGNYENDAALGLSCTETTRNAAANKLYGKSFQDLSEEQKQLTLMQMVEDANEASGALGQAARESDTWTNQLGNLKQAFKDVMAIVGEVFLNDMVGAVQTVSEYVQNNKETIKAWAEAVRAKIVSMWNAVKPVFDFIKKHFDTIKAVVIAVIAAFAGFSAIVKILSIVSTAAALVTNPIGLIVVAIAAVIGIVVLLWQKCEWFRNAVKAIFEAIKTVVMMWVNVCIAYFTLWKNILITIFNAVKTAVRFVIEKFIAFKNKCLEVKNAVINGFRTMKNQVCAFFDKIKAKIQPLIDKVIAFKNAVADSKVGQMVSGWLGGGDTPEHATGTSYWRGGLTSVNEGGRGEILNLPNGTQIIPHDVSKKAVQGGGNVTVNVTIQGNVVGNEAFANQIGAIIAKRVITANGNSF